MKSPFHLLTIIFVIAKMLGYFNYSWWVVFAPSIVAVVLALTLVIGTIALTIALDK